MPASCATGADTFMTKTKEERAKVKAKALRDYRRGEPLKVIAIRYGCSPASISLWAQSAGLERRQQGCRLKDWPDDTDLEIVEAVRAVRDGKPTLTEIGERWHMSRANVHRIYHRWKDWKPSVQFKPGDKVRFMRRDYEVLEPRAFDGKVRDLKTGQESVIRWRADDNFAVKLNVERQPAM